MKKSELSVWALVTSILLILGASVVLSPVSSRVQADQDVDVRNEATEVTKSYNQQFYSLPFSNQEDYDHADWGFIAKPEVLTIAKREITECYPGNCQGGCTSFGDECEENADKLVWDLESYKDYIVPTAPPVDDSDPTHRAPETVNPSLWRNAQLNMKYGLFRVAGTAGANESDPTHNLELALADRESSIYQVRGYDLSNITFIKGSNGWIVFDPLISPETAEAAFQWLNEQIPWKNQNVSVVIYSHSHVDHYGGAPGLFGRDSSGLDYADPEGVEFIAPEGFTEHAVSENVIAGNAMARRAIYMYGALLPRDAQGGVNGGLGQTTSTGEAGLIKPTILVLEEDETLVDDGGQPLGGGGLVGPSGTYQGQQAYSVDGVDMIFQMTPGTEAPSEMNTWIPARKALWMAENTTNTMHNILTLRGAQVRDANKWVSFLSETIRDWGALAEVKFQSHHWPLWTAVAGPNSEVVSYLEKQRDAYKFVHDQTVRLMNNGYTGEEISEKIEWLLPDSLKSTWSTRGYYGTLRHNSRAVYQFYMGWYDGHPSDLNNLPPEEVAVRYVDYMERDGTLYEKAFEDFTRADATYDDYRWVAEVMKHAVFADDEDDEARELLADVLEQLGYMAESGPWRSVYLQGAYELRNTDPLPGGTQTATPDTIKAMPPEMIFDFLAVHLCTRVVPVEDDCSIPAADRDIIIQMFIDDWNPAGTYYTLTVRNGVLNYEERSEPGAEVKLTTSMAGLQQLLIDQDGRGIHVDEGQSLYEEFVQMLDLVDDFQFNIVTP